MTITDTLTVESPLTVREAAQDRRDARLRLASYDLEYRAARDSNRAQVVARARAQYGVALYEYVHSLVACAEAEDRYKVIEEPDAATVLLQPDDHVALTSADEEAASSGDLSPAEAQVRLTLAHGRHDGCWQAYEEARRTGNAPAVAAARGEWEQGLSLWMRALLACREAEDLAKIAAMQARQDEALKFQPGDAFPRSRAATLAEESKERARREALWRDRNRYRDS